MIKLVKLNQIFWPKPAATQTSVDPVNLGPTLLPVVINPHYIVSFIEDEVANETPIVGIGAVNIEKCTAVLVQGMEQPYFVKETLEEVQAAIESCGSKKP